VTKFLKSNYSLSEAEDHYGVNYFEDLTSFNPGTRTPKSVASEIPPLSPIFGHSPSVDKLASSTSIGDTVFRMISLFKMEMSTRMRKQFITYLIKLCIEQEYGLPFLNFVHGNIFETSRNAMHTLYSEGKHNLVYHLSKAIAEGKLTLDRMPYGLLDYNIRFFSATTTVGLEMEDHYASWQETMLVHFGHKWVSLNRGPMWQYEEEYSEKESEDIVAKALFLSGADT
jgi:hypothetical protein